MNNYAYIVCEIFINNCFYDLARYAMGGRTS